VLLQADSEESLDALSAFGFFGIFDKIKSSNKLVGTNCSPMGFWGGSANFACDNTPVCCEDNVENGLFAFGCTNILLPLDIF
jgi:hypothetical protein